MQLDHSNESECRNIWKTYNDALNSALNKIRPCKQTSPSNILGFLLACGRLCLCCFLSATANHRNTEERSNDRRAQKSENNGDSYCPYARREKIVERVSLVNERLAQVSISTARIQNKRRWLLTISKVHAV